MLVVNFQEFAPVPMATFSCGELAGVLAVAERMLLQVQPEVMERTIDSWLTALIWTGITADGVTREWYQRAVLILCILGLQGKIQPEIYTLGWND